MNVALTAVTCEVDCGLLLIGRTSSCDHLRPTRYLGETLWSLDTTARLIEATNVSSDLGSPRDECLTVPSLPPPDL